jgi:hypothetical protein
MMEQTVCSEMFAFKLQMPVDHQEESIRHLEHGESLKKMMPQAITRLSATTVVQPIL